MGQHDFCSLGVSFVQKRVSTPGPHAWSFEAISAGSYTVQAKALLASGRSLVQFPELSGPNAVSVAQGQVTDLQNTFISAPFKQTHQIEALPGQQVSGRSETICFGEFSITLQSDPAFEIYSPYLRVNNATLGQLLDENGVPLICNNLDTLMVPASGDLDCGEAQEACIQLAMKPYRPLRRG